MRRKIRKTFLLLLALWLVTPVPLVGLVFLLPLPVLLVLQPRLLKPLPRYLVMRARRLRRSTKR